MKPFRSSWIGETVLCALYKIKLALSFAPGFGIMFYNSIILYIVIDHNFVWHIYMILLFSFTKYQITLPGLEIIRDGNDFRQYLPGYHQHNIVGFSSNCNNDDFASYTFNITFNITYRLPMFSTLPNTCFVYAILFL